MYAALINLYIDSEYAPQAAATFTKDILPQVKNTTGFIAGYWVDPIDGEGFGFILFENANQARAATPPSANWDAPGVVIKKVAIRRVAVSIP